MQTWAKVGALIRVDGKIFEAEPQKAIVEAVTRGDYTLDSGSYAPTDYASGKQETVPEQKTGEEYEVVK